MSKFKKPLFIFSGTVLTVAILIILFISPIVKYLVEKYDEKYTGRQITMDWAYVNPFTGYLHFNNLKIYELKSDSIFFSANGVSANVSMLKLFSKTYEISQLTLDGAFGIIIQKKKKLNLDDLIEKFSSKPNSTSINEPVHFSILSIKINKGELHYSETITPINLFITNLDLESSGIRWNSDTIAAKCSFFSGIGKGDINGDFSINTNNLDYRINAAIHKFDLNFINQYLKDLSNSGSFRATLNADLKTTGNFKEAQNLNAQGKIVITDFHFGKDIIDDYTSFDKLVVDINQLNPKNHKYLFDSLLLTHPFLKYEEYDYLDNIEVMFGKKESLVIDAKKNPEKFNLVLEIGKYIKLLSKNFFSSYYQIKRLVVSNGNAQYNDYTLSEKFSMTANPLFITADSIDKNHKRVKLVFKSSIHPYGNASVFLSINPNDSSDFDMSYHLQHLSLPMFNPYLIFFTSFPLDRGTLELNGKWNVRKGFIQSTNHLLVIDPRISKQIRKKGTKWVPLPLIMAFVRERGNVIDYEIPITGNMKNPKFHWRQAIFDVIKNILVKPPTTPYGLEVRNVENEIEKLQSIKWEMRRFHLDHNQKKFIREMANFLEENSETSISVYPIEYIEKEKEYILFFEAKKKYFLLTRHKNNLLFSEEDSIKVEKMQIKNIAFLQYLTKYCSDSTLYNVQAKCYRFVGGTLVNSKYNQLMKERENAIRFYFTKNNTNTRLKIYPPENKIPYTGFSYFKIKYKGDIPKSLSKAYQRMNELNDETPRKQFNENRKKNASTL